MQTKAWIILLIIVLGGALGGVVGAFLDEDGPGKLHWFKRLVVGIGCAFLVPLFLNMISSTLLDNVDQSPSPYFVFGGFCVIAAISSKAFISNISNKLLRDVREVKEDVRNVEARVQAVIVKETEPEPVGDNAFTDSARALGLPDPQQQVLAALNRGKYSMRSLYGIGKDADMDVHTVAGNISHLQRLGLVARVEGSNGKAYWSLTEGGKAAVAAAETALPPRSA